MELEATLPSRLKIAMSTMPYAKCTMVIDNRTTKDGLSRPLRAYTLSVPSILPSSPGLHTWDSGYR